MKKYIDNADLQSFFNHKIKPYIASLLRVKADKAQSLAGYGIKDVKITNGNVSISGQTADVVDKVDKTTTINGHALSGNVTVSFNDLPDKPTFTVSNEKLTIG